MIAKQSPGKKLLYENWDSSSAGIQAVTERFLRANALNPEITLEIARCQVRN
jgi:hypothetical protein